MALNKLAHYSIRTLDVDASCRFYVDILGCRAGFRPPFDFPGAWLYLGDDESDYGVIHLIGVDLDHPEGLTAYLGDRAPETLSGATGALDHIAFLATDLSALREKLATKAIDFRERTVPSLGLHQVFLEDPSGITIELNFPAAEAHAA